VHCGIPSAYVDKVQLGFLGRRQQAKMQWLQDPNQNNVDNLTK